MKPGQRAKVGMTRKERQRARGRSVYGLPPMPETDAHQRSLIAALTRARRIRSYPW